MSYKESVVLDPELQKEGVAVGCTVYTVRAGQVWALIMNFNQHEVQLRLRKKLANVFVEEEVLHPWKEPRYMEVSHASSDVVVLDATKEKSISGDRNQLLREVCLEGAQLSESERAELVSVLEVHESAFSLHEADYGLMTTLMEKIPTGDA